MIELGSMLDPQFREVCYAFWWANSYAFLFRWLWGFHAEKQTDIEKCRYDWNCEHAETEMPYVLLVFLVGWFANCLIVMRKHSSQHFLDDLV